MVREARAQTGDDLYKKAAQEGIVNFYGTLAQINAKKILPVFDKRYAGVSGRAQQLVDAIQNIEQIRDKRARATPHNRFVTDLENAKDNFISL
jgi:hypothetical protein